MAEKATTKTGFAVDVWQNNKQYTTGIKASDEFMKEYSVTFNEFIPLRNYSLKVF